MLGVLSIGLRRRAPGAWTVTPGLINLVLLVVDALVYFAALALLFGLRGKLGIGAFFCALGVMHFIETYLASIFYIALPFGIVTSPGSTVMFTGKLMLLLLVYIREDAAVVRQPIYGLLIGNLLVVTFAMLMRGHELMALAPGRLADFVFLDEMGALMVLGTALLFIDSILLILLYERTRSWFENRLLARLLVSGAVIMTFDQIFFFLGLHVLTGAPASVLIGGWAAKMAAVLLYSVLVYAYLRWWEPSVSDARPILPISDVFDTLTYRERYEDLLVRSGRDALTGVFNRGQLEGYGRRMVENAALARRPTSLLLIDIDHFKDFNDRYGHSAGDEVLRRIARNIMGTVRATDPVFRYGGEEFVVISDGLTDEAAFLLGERWRQAIATGSRGAPREVTASIGIASSPADALDYDALFQLADRRLYAAKAAGRDRVVGRGGALGGAVAKQDRAGLRS